MTRRITSLGGLVLIAALLGAGCGGGESEPELYRLEPTRSCLEGAGLEVTTEELDFVASTATGGALRTDIAANHATVSFGETPEEAERTAEAYRNFAGPRIPIDHVLFRYENAVVVWGAPPSEEERTRVVSCLAA